MSYDAATPEVNLEFGTAHDRELWRAAEAVVDAAFWIAEGKSGVRPDARVREALIEAVFHDPTLTPFLFRAGGCSLQ